MAVSRNSKNSSIFRSFAFVVNWGSKSPPLVNTTEINPCIQLQPFVRSFTYRELAPLVKTSRPLFATHDFIITFNLSETKFGFIKPANRELPQPEQPMNSCVVITGIGTQFAGMMTGDGYARLFSIYFTPVGFFRIFGIPAVHFTNVVEEDVYTCNKNLENLREQLIISKSIADMINCCEIFLIQQLTKSKVSDTCGSIPGMAGYILHHNTCNCSVERLAYEANMSIKTFERKFTEQVGCSPKLFSRIVRFNKAITLKMNNFHKSWTDIAHVCGYYDQMHFIKDFKLFSGATPTDFFKQTPPVFENLTVSRINHPSSL